MQAQRFDINKAPVPPLRAEPRPTRLQTQGVEATPGGLIRSTLLAAAGGAAILILFLLPAEYGIDPTGIGGVIGLAEMGEIKQQLYAEAAAPEVAAEPATEAAPWRDEFSYTLPPGEGIEVKLVMQEGAVATFEWSANGGVLNYDTHADGSGQQISYEQGRAVPDQAGTLTAAFTGNHGWFWRNRSDAPVTLTLRTAGDYTEMKAP